MRRRAVALATLLVLAVPGAAHAADGRASLADVPLSGPLSVPTLERLGFDLVHGAPTARARVVLHSDAERRALAAAGYPAAEVVADLRAYHARARRADARAAAAGTRSALPSGRVTYRHPSDYTRSLDRLAAAHPRHVRRVDLPLRSVEGRPLAGVEIADRVRRADDGRPTFLVLGLHHAREWPSGEVALELALDLARRHRRDPRITRLLGRVRVLVVPVVNPDGFRVSRGEVAGPDPVAPAFPLHRKNCRVDESGPQEPCPLRDGVDLNRNYAAFWGGPGASVDPRDETFRGPGPWSEPEAAAVHELSRTRHVTGVQSLHNVAALVLRPPGVRAMGRAPDEARLAALGRRLARATGYASLRGWELYDVSGATEDWNYVAQGAPGYTIELGGGVPGTFQGPYRSHVIRQYLGRDRALGGRDGVREALLIAAEDAADPAGHAVLAGTAPPGARLRLARTFTTATSRVCRTDACVATDPARAVPDGIDTTTVVPASGRFRWHVGPSTRPYERAAGRTERWRLRCEAPDGRAGEIALAVRAGERRAIDPPCGGTPAPAPAR